MDTSFLPDDGKDDRDMELRNQLRVEWLNQQTKLKNQELCFMLLSARRLTCLTFSIFKTKQDP